MATLDISHYRHHRLRSVLTRQRTEAPRSRQGMEVHIVNHQFRQQPDDSTISSQFDRIGNRPAMSGPRKGLYLNDNFLESRMGGYSTAGINDSRFDRGFYVKFIHGLPKTLQGGLINGHDPQQTSMAQAID